jgi:CheY-like chemotaxis protein
VIRADSPYAAIRALIIDDMSIQQSALRGQLNSLGLAQVDAAASADDALRYLRRGAYQLILCDYNLNSRTDGQQLFEYLREQEVLPEDCLFFMVTAEAQYAAVAATSEHAPDAYLLKPITVGDIEERLQVQLDKRQALAPITQAMNRKDYGAALAGANAAGSCRPFSSKRGCNCSSESSTRRWHCTARPCNCARSCCGPKSG